MTLRKLNSANFDEIIYDQGKQCLIVFTRKTCYVCQSVVPIIEELQPNYQNKCGFYYVDVEEENGLFHRFSFKGVPQILFFNGGEYQGKLAGKVDESQIEDKLKEL